MKKCLCIVAVVFFIAVITRPVSAEDGSGTMKRDVLYGAAAGVAIGAIALAASGDGDRSLAYIGGGLVLGAAGGAAYNYATGSLGDSLAIVEDGKVKFQFPRINVTAVKEDLTQSVEIVRSINILKLHF